MLLCYECFNFYEREEEDENEESYTFNMEDEVKIGAFQQIGSVQMIGRELKMTNMLQLASIYGESQIADSFKSFVNRCHVQKLEQRVKNL